MRHTRTRGILLRCCAKATWGLENVYLFQAHSTVVSDLYYLSIR